MNELKIIDDIDKAIGKDELTYVQCLRLMHLIDQFTTRKELEAKEQELEVLKRLDLEFNVVICGCGEPYKDTDPHDIVKDRINQLSTELTNKEMK